MKNYTITVNGNVYDVTVEENGASPSAPVSAPVSAPAPKAQPQGNAGSTNLTAPMPGKVLRIDAGVGTQVKKGDTVMVFEAMKMENSVVAPEDGTIASINVQVGNEFESGDVLATM